MNYEIQDDGGVIFFGDFTKMLLAWNVNNLNDDTFEKFYGYPKSVWSKEYKLKKWKGDLKLCIVVNAVPCRK
jgi:hypothetical protein